MSYSRMMSSGARPAADRFRFHLSVVSSIHQRVRTSSREYSDVKWASRWDVYLYATDEQIHWFSILNSLMIVLFLSGMLAMIMMRTLHRDLRRYNDAESKEEAQEESGWKVRGRSRVPASRAAWAPRAIAVCCVRGAIEILRARKRCLKVVPISLLAACSRRRLPSTTARRSTCRISWHWRAGPQRWSVAGLFSSAAVHIAGARRSRDGR